MSNAVGEQILDGLVALVSGLGILQPNQTTMPIVKRKVPKKEELVDGTYMVTLSFREEMDNYAYMAFNDKLVYYFVEVVVIAPNDADNLTNLDLYLEWREIIRDTILATPRLIPAVTFNVDALGGPFLKRDEYREDFDYMGITFKYTATEN